MSCKAGVSMTCDCKEQQEHASFLNAQCVRIIEFGVLTKEHVVP